MGAGEVFFEMAGIELIDTAVAMFRLVVTLLWVPAVTAPAEGATDRNLARHGQSYSAGRQ